MIDWLNPSDDILDARSIGFAEGQQSRDEEVADLTAERDALAAELARLRRLEEAAIHWNTHRCVHGVGRLERAVEKAQKARKQ